MPLPTYLSLRTLHVVPRISCLESRPDLFHPLTDKPEKREHHERDDKPRREPDIADNCGSSPL